MGTLRYYDQLAAFEEEAMQGVQYLSVAYERDLLHREAHQKTANRIFEYLGVPPHPVEAHSSPTSKPRISSYIENYEEVVDAMEESAFAHLLPEKA